MTDSATNADTLQDISSSWRQSLDLTSSASLLADEEPGDPTPKPEVTAAEQPIERVTRSTRVKRTTSPDPA